MKTQDLRVWVVDPGWTQNDRFWGFGPWLDPASTLVIHMLSAHARFASTIQIPVQNMLLRQDREISL